MERLKHVSAAVVGDAATASGNVYETLSVVDKAAMSISNVSPPASILDVVAPSYELTVVVYLLTCREILASNIFALRPATSVKGGLCEHDSLFETSLATTLTTPNA